MKKRTIFKRISTTLLLVCLVSSAYIIAGCSTGHDNIKFFYDMNLMFSPALTLESNKNADNEIMTADIEMIKTGSLYSRTFTHIIMVIDDTSYDYFIEYSCFWLDTHPLTGKESICIAANGQQEQNITFLSDIYFSTDDCRADVYVQIYNLRGVKQLWLSFYRS